MSSVHLMNRYSGGHNVLHLGAFAAPLIPFVAVSAMYDTPVYAASWIDISILWVVGLAIGYLLIAIHEAGHVLAGRFVGIGTEIVTIGHWRKLVSFTFGGMPITVRAAPETGYVTPRSSAEYVVRWRRSIYFLGGVLAEALVVLGCMHFLHRPDDILGFSDLLIAFLYISVAAVGGLQILWSLIPNKGWVSGSLLANDGLQLLQLWKDRSVVVRQAQLFSELQEVEQLRVAGKRAQAAEKAEAIHQRYPENIALLSFVGALHSENGNLGKAETTWREVLTRSDASASARAQVLDSLSCLVLFHGRDDLLSAADEWSSEALHLVPNAITLKGTRASVLIELGRGEEGIEMLHEVVQRSEDTTDQTISAAYLAKAYSARGDHTQARKWLDKACAIDPEHVVVKRIIREFTSAGLAKN